MVNSSRLQEPAPPWQGAAKTVHETKYVRAVLRRLALVLFKFAGWKVEGQRPDIPKYVVIAAPHTSNWDFFYAVCLAFIYRMKPLFMMKDAWFFWPIGPVFRWLGAMPIDRSKSNNVVRQSIAEFEQRRELALVVPPSGTRKHVTHWKTGFYHIARGANVPILMGFLDYRRRVGGFGGLLRPTGNLDHDMQEIRAFYRDIPGKHLGAFLGAVRMTGDSSRPVASE
jgi:1-acyl-sn-glycerol-3-phosphate acyltransferase